VPQDEQLDVFGAAVAGELGQHLQDLAENLVASEGFMTRIITATGQQQADNVARQRLEPILRAAPATMPCAQAEIQYDPQRPLSFRPAGSVLRRFQQRVTRAVRAVRDETRRAAPGAADSLRRELREAYGR
jgi:hypothetical protein